MLLKYASSVALKFLKTLDRLKLTTPVICGTDKYLLNCTERRRGSIRREGVPQLSKNGLYFPFVSRHLVAPPMLPLIDSKIFLINHPYDDAVLIACLPPPWQSQSIRLVFEQP